VEPFDVVEFPDLFTEQAQTHLHKPMVEVGQDDIILPLAIS
jgi:hypothetical protein